MTTRRHARAPWTDDAEPCATRGARTPRWSSRTRLTLAALLVAGSLASAGPASTAASPASSVGTAVGTSVGTAGGAVGTGAAACSTRWGTGAKGVLPARLTSGHLTDVRAGRHACFDRIVLDVDAPLTARSYSVRYVRAVRADGSGDRVPLRGQAALEVIVAVPAYDSQGRPTYTPRNPRELVATGSLRAVRQVAWAGSFEGQTTLGIGVATRRPMRAFTLRSDGHHRLVIDIAHR